MGARIRYKRIKESYWFRPVLFIILALIVSRALLLADQIIHDLGYDMEDIWWIVKSSPLEASRDSFSTQATVLLGLFGVLLSLALIPLTIATSSYGNVVLRTFLRDKGTQNTIGFFAFVIFFDITVVIALPTTITLDNYPGITLTFSFILLLATLMMTIYFFNHVANLLQATYITKSLTDELMAELESSYLSSPSEFSEEQKETFVKERESIFDNGTLVRSSRYGYVAGLNYHLILKKAERADATVLILKLPGDYVSQNEPLARYIVKGKLLRPKAFSKSLDSAYIFGVNRTVMQDIDYGVQLLAIIASRALSPAVNDPITATICIDKIGQVLSKVVSRPTRSPYILGKKGALRLIADPDDFKSLMSTGFNQIRQYGSKAYEVMVHALYAIETIAYAASDVSDKRIIKYHADLILQESLDNLGSEWSKEQVRDAYNSAIDVIGLDEESQRLQPVAS